MPWMQREGNRVRETGPEVVRVSSISPSCREGEALAEVRELPGGSGGGLCSRRSQHSERVPVWREPGAWPGGRSRREERGDGPSALLPWLGGGGPVGAVKCATCLGSGQRCAGCGAGDGDDGAVRSVRRNGEGEGSVQVTKRQNSGRRDSLFSFYKREDASSPARSQRKPDGGCKH